MRLASGTRLGPYEILVPLGAGGMGEVYRARDTRLGRDVAVKILSADIAASADARQRFEREARTVSQLSHPHICALYDVGEAPNPQSPIPNPYLVMELLDGETLAQRLASGALPLDLTLRYATQIADALDKAHRAGIVHRDLKPANVMITKSGVKLLDFGLAKATTPSSISVAQTAAPLTAAGAIAGTVQYMAPEQLAGRAADARSDIYALGAVIYEMATGRAAFGAALTPLVPASLDRLVRTALASDPDERWQSAHDVQLQLRAIAEASDAGGTAAPAGVPGRAAWLPWILAAVAIIVATAALGVIWFGSRSNGSTAAPAAAVRFLIAPPAGGAFSDTVETVCIALSPDGSQLAYVAADATGDRRVWLRPISSVAARSVGGTEGARTVFWSPDGKSLAFFAGEKLKRIDLPDNAPITLSEAPDVGVVGSWGDGQIVFSMIPGGLFRVPASGGPPVKILSPDFARRETSLVWPWFLPDGRRLLYLVRHPDGNGTLMVYEPGQPPRVVLANIVSSAQYVDPGYILYARDGTLLGQRFDVASAMVSGEPFPVAEPVRYFYSTGMATFATSLSGVLVYQPHAELGRLVWLDRAGREIGVIGEGAAYLRARISADGGRVLFSRAQPQVGTYDLWLFDIARGVEQRLTSDRLSEVSAVWLPGGTATIFSGRVPPHLFRKDLGTGEETELIPAPNFALGEDVSPDGTTFVFILRTPRGSFDIWQLPLDGASQPVPVLETPFDKEHVRFSPDGRYLAFASNELGKYEVFVAPFPGTGERIRVSVGGAGLPRWSRDGRELFFVSEDRHLMAVPVRTSPSLVLGAPRPLFSVAGGSEWSDPRATAVWADFDVAPDGSRFLAAIPQPANEQPLTAVLNWQTALLRK